MKDSFLAQELLSTNPDTWSSWGTYIIEYDDHTGCLKSIQREGSLLSSHPEQFRVLDEKKNKYYWLCITTDLLLYKIERNDRTQAVEKATSYGTKGKSVSKGNFAEKGITGTYDETAYNAMMTSYELHKMQRLLITYIEDLFPRSADTVKSDMLIAPENDKDAALRWQLTVFEKYRQYVVGKLKDIVHSAKDPEALINGLTIFLKEHWTVICGSFSYTATSVVREMLAGIAVWLGDVLGKPAITLLMPDVVLHPVMEQEYPNLANIPLTHIFNRYIVFRDHYLLPVSLLLAHCKVHNEKDRSAQSLQNPYYDLYSDYNKEEKYLTVDDITLQRLEQHSDETRALSDAFKTYDALVHDESHLLGQLRSFRKKLAIYDGHGGLGTHEEAGSGTWSALAVFTEYYRNLEPCGLSVQKNIPTVDDLPKDQNIGYVLVTAENPDNTTLYFLNRFDNTVVPIAIKKDVNQKDRVRLGIPEGQTIPAYLASMFSGNRTPCTNNELYLVTQLTGHDYISGYTHIPQDLRRTIETFLSYQDYATNQAHWAATCTGSNGEAIDRLIGKYQEKLISIGPNPEEQKRQLNHAITTLEAQRASFAQSLRDDTYRGADSGLGLPLALFKEMDITLRAHDWNSLASFNTLLEQDIHELLMDTVLREDVLRLITSSIETFLIYITETPVVPLRAMLTALKKDLESRLSCDIIFFGKKKFSPILGMLIPALVSEKTSLLLEVFGDTIQFMRDVYIVLQYITPEQHTVVYEAIKTRIPELITNTNDLDGVSRCLRLEQYTAVLVAIKDRLPELIKSAKDVVFLVLKNLTPEQHTVVYEAIKTRIPELITNTNDLDIVSRCLRPEQYTAVLVAIKGRLPELIKSAKGASLVLKNLTREQHTVVLEAIKDRLPQLIESADDVHTVLDNLTVEQFTVVYEVIKTRIPELINSVYDIGPVLCNLTFEQRTVVYEAIKTRIPELINSAIDVCTVLRYLTPEQCTVALESIKDRLPELIQSVKDVGPVLCFLTPEQCTVALESIKDRLTELIKSAKDVAAVLRLLTPEQCTAVLEAIKDRFPELIKSAKDVAAVLRFLTPEQFTVVLEAIKDRFPELIKSAKDAGAVLRLLTVEQFTVVYEVIKTRISEPIKGFDHLLMLENASFNEIPEKFIFGYVFCKNNGKAELFYYDKAKNGGVPLKLELKQELVGAEKELDFDVFLHKIFGKSLENPKIIQLSDEDFKSITFFTGHTLIKSADDVGAVLRDLEPEQCTVVLEAIKDRFPELINSADDVGAVLRDLEPEQCTVVLEAIKECLPELINSVDDVRAVLRDLEPEQCTVVLEAIKERLPELIQSANDVGGVLSNLSFRNHAVVYEAIKTYIPKFIESSHDVGIVLSNLVLTQCKKVCRNIPQKDLLKLFQSSTSLPLFPDHQKEKEKFLKTCVIQAHYARICDEYIEKLTENLSKAGYTDTTPPPEKDKVAYLTSEKKRIVTEAKQCLMKTEENPETNIAACLGVLTSETNKGILSQQRDTCFMAAAKVMGTFGLIYLYRALKGETTTINKNIGFFKRTDPTDGKVLNNNIIDNVASYHSAP